MTASSDLTKMLSDDITDGLPLTQDGYDSAMQTLLHLDFANLEVAVRSTYKWIMEVRNAAGVQTDWSLEILGTAKLGHESKHAVGNGLPSVNDLGSIIRKKRKAEDSSTSNAYDVGERVIPAHKTPPVNVLGGGMVRKKSKASG